MLATRYRSGEADRLRCSNFGGEPCMRSHRAHGRIKVTTRPLMKHSWRSAILLEPKWLGQDADTSLSDEPLTPTPDRAPPHTQSHTHPHARKHSRAPWFRGGGACTGFSAVAPLTSRRALTLSAPEHQRFERRSRDGYRRGRVDAPLATLDWARIACPERRSRKRHMVHEACTTSCA